MADTEKDSAPQPDLPLDLTINVTGGLKKRLHGEVKADRRACEQTAALLDVPKVSEFQCSYELSPAGPDKYLAQGRVQGRLTQTCVVTGELLEQVIDEPFRAFFWPLEESLKWWKTMSADQLFDDAEVESYEDGCIDLGRYIYETFAAALDPYPRKPGAVFAPEQLSGADGAQEAPEDSANPFAVLKQLRKQVS